MIRFHLDQHIPFAIARGLRLRGIDVTTTAEAGLQGAADLEHIAFALAQRRTILTHDDDFIRLHSSRIDHAGIVYCKQGRATVGQVVRHLELLSHCLDSEEMYRQLEYL